MRRIAFAVLLMGFCLAYWVWQFQIRYYRRSHPLPYIEVAVGDRICRPDHNPWASVRSSAYAIVGAAACAACRESRPFEEELFEYARSQGLKTYYVLSADREDDERASELKAEGRTVLRMQATDLGISRIPTFLRISADGVIESMWSNSVPRTVHDEVLAGVTQGRMQEYFRSAASELPKYISDSSYQMVALSKIGRREDSRAIVMPFKDLIVRARYELQRNRPVAIDCGSLLSTLSCQMGAMDLSKLKFSKVVAVGLPSRPPCY